MADVNVTDKVTDVPRVTFAPTTPFQRYGELDIPGLERTITWLKGQGVESIIAGGTTGEFAAMNAAERLEVLRATRRALGPSGYLFANVSACAIDDVIDLTRQALNSDARPNALLLLPPYYHRPFSEASGEAGIESFFVQALNRMRREIQKCGAAPSPVVFLYTFALHTQQPISAALYGRLVQAFPGVVGGIKASFVGLEQALAYAAAAPGTTVLVGNGRIQLGCLRAGLHVVSGDCVTVPWALLKLTSLHEAGEAAIAERAQEALVDVWRGEMDQHDEIPIDKAAFSAIPEVATLPTVRPPLVIVSSDATAAIVDASKRLRAAFDDLPLVNLKRWAQRHRPPSLHPAQ